MQTLLCVVRPHVCVVVVVVVVFGVVAAVVRGQCWSRLQSAAPNLATDAGVVRTAAESLLAAVDDDRGPSS